MPLFVKNKLMLRSLMTFILLSKEILNKTDKLNLKS